MRSKPIDYDALFKDFIGDFFPDFVAFVHPELYAAIDWAQGYVFLEQELINALRGKFKIRGKRKYTDKLVKVQLLSGGVHYIFVHVEFQHEPEPGFARRMFLYRTLIQLRYGLDEITAFAVFTGAPPPMEETQYQQDTFGTRVEYQFQSIIAATLEETKLLQEADNAFALAMLAAQYAYRSRNKPKLRLELKAKLFALIRSSTTPFEKIVQLFIFVRDFVHLPDTLEEDFLAKQYYLTFPNESAMIISEGTKKMALGMFERAFGYNPDKVLAEQKKKAEEERLRAQTERQRLLQTIQNLHQLLQMDSAQIALMVGIAEAEVQEILEGDAGALDRDEMTP
jgi:hypothetical protein